MNYYVGLKRLPASQLPSYDQPGKQAAAKKEHRNRLGGAPSRNVVIVNDFCITRALDSRTYSKGLRYPMWRQHVGEALAVAFRSAV